MRHCYLHLVIRYRRQNIITRQWGNRGDVLARRLWNIEFSYQYYERYNRCILVFFWPYVNTTAINTGIIGY